MKIALSILFLIAVAVKHNDLQAQSQHKKGTALKGKSATDFPELVFTKIPGAPILQMPKLIMGSTKPLVSEGMGWAAPALFDVDNDGKKDLLLGEFGSRLEDKGIPAGNFVRVYKNEGESEAPRFSDNYSYLYPNEAESTGTPLSVYTWCCMGFTPQVVDLDNDGYDDLVTGQYNPGFVTWFRGSDEEFHAGQKLPQFGDPMVGNKQRDYSISRLDPKSWEYWNYSSVAFGDFDGRGLYDMIIGGTALRISKNTGTKTNPSFGKRELLLDINGHPLRVGPKKDTLKNEAGEPFYGNCMVPTVADWNQDGLPDLLVTDAYLETGCVTITFFKAVQTPAGIRFEPGVPMFTARNGGKAFPGSWPRVCVADWNNDGINDLIIGTSVATLSGKFDHPLSWEWESKTDIVKKRPLYYSEEFTQLIEKQLKDADSIQAKMGLSDAEMVKMNYSTRKSLFKHYYVKESYKSLAHKGYVYVLMGTLKD